jgi:hypothetical protein
LVPSFFLLEGKYSTPQKSTRNERAYNYYIPFLSGAIMNLPGFTTLIWLFPLALLVHELEEWTILGWYRRNFTGELPKTERPLRAVLLAVSLAGFAWTLLAALSGDAKTAAMVMLPFFFVALLNTLQHLWWWILFKQYAPGAVSAIFLLWPITVFLTAYVLLRGWVPLWYTLMLGGSVVLVLVLTVRARNRLLPMFHVLHGIGERLSGVGINTKHKKNPKNKKENQDRPSDCNVLSFSSLRSTEGEGVVYKSILFFRLPAPTDVRDHPSSQVCCVQQTSPSDAY